MSQSIPKRLGHFHRVARIYFVPVTIAFALVGQPVRAALITGWGANDAQQLEPPLWVTNAVSVSAGAAHAVALLATGEAVAWGDNTFGQTSIPPGTGSFVSVAAGFRHSLALQVDGSIASWGDNNLGQTSPPAGTNYVAIAAGGAHSLALRLNGTVAAWGANHYGQTNVPLLLGSIRAIAAGGYHSLAVQSNGLVFAWGSNSDGQRTVPLAASNVVGVAAGFRHSLALRSDGTVVAWGSNAQGQRDVPAHLSNVVAIAAGESQSLALRQDGTLAVWGAAAGGVTTPERIGQIQSMSGGRNFALALVQAPAVLRQPADVFIVPGQPITLTAVVAGSDSTTFQWQKDGTDLSAQTNLSLNIINPVFSDFGDYRLRVQDGPAVVFSQVARLIAPPVIVAHPQASRVFNGDTSLFQITATGTAPLAYQWYFGTLPIPGRTNSSFAVSNAAYSNGGLYYVVITNIAGSVTSSPVALDVYTKPVLNIWCSTPNLGFGGTLIIDSSVSGVSVNAFQWQLNGMDIPGETNSNLKVSDSRPSITGTYRYRATVAGGSFYSPTQAVTVARAVLTNYVGRRVILDAGLGCGLAREFRWFRDGTELSGATNSTLRMEPLKADDAGNYTAAVRFDTGEQIFNIAGLTVVEAPPGPAIIDQPAGGARDVGQSFEFNVRAWSGEPITTWQWRHNGTNIPGAQASSLLLTNLQLMDVGEYSVAVTSAGVTVVSDPAILNVYRPPFLSLPSTRGEIVVWGGLNFNLATATPAELDEVAVISAGPLSYGRSYAIGSDGRVTIWDHWATNRLAQTNLLSVVPWGNFYLGLQANGVVASWDSTSLAPASAPAGLRNVVQLVGNGSGSYVAVHEDGTIRHSGTTGFFPANLADVVQASHGQYHAVALRGDGTVVMSAISPPSRQTAAPAGLTNVVQVAAGAEHTLALAADGTVVAWGRTNEGQCLVPAGLTNVIAVAAGANFSMALRADGTVAVWGDGTQGQTLLPPGLTNVAAIAAGNSHCLAIRRGPIRLSGPSDLNVAPGQVGTFEVVAQGVEPLHYQWSFTGETIPNATNSILQVAAGPETEGMYSVAVSNSQGSFSTSAMLWLGLPPEILVHPDGAVVADNASWTFMVLASGLGPLRYQWLANGTNIVGATNSTYAVSSATSSRAGIYVVKVENRFGTTSSREVQLVVMSPPSIVIQPVSLMRAEGETARLTAVTSGGQPQWLQWYFGGMPLSGQTNAALDISGITTNQAGSYWVRVTNHVGIATSQSAVLTVVGRAPVITQSPVDRAAHFGDAVNFTVAATGASPLRYQWWHDSEPIAGANSNTLSLTRVDRGDEGSYGVVVWNAAGSVTSAPPAQLTLTVGPNVVIWGTNTLVQAIPPDLTNAVALAASTHMLALKSDGTIAGWGLNDYGQATVPAGLSNVVAVAAGSAHSLALKADGRVVAWGYDFGGWGLTNVPTNLTNAVGIAAGSLHSLALRSDGTVVGWGYNAYGQATPPAGLSNVVGLTANHDATVALKANGTVTHWGNGYYGGDSLANIIGVMGRGRMLALRNDHRMLGWGWTTGAAVEGPPGLVAADSYTVPYKQGNTTYLETHEIGLLTNGTVAVWGANRGGIFNPPALSNVLAVSAGSFFNAAVVGGPTLLRHPVSRTIGAGADATLTSEAVGRNPLRYQWRFNGQDLWGETNASLTISSATPASNGQYAVQVADSTGTIVSRPATVQVVTASPYVLGQPESISAAEGTDVSFSVEAVGIEPLEYQWSHNGSLVPGATEQVLALPAASASDAGIYSVVVSNWHGVAVSSNAILTLSLPDLIVDNTNAVVSGPWQSGANPGQIGTNYLFIRPGFGANEVRFVPNLPRAGQYQVWTRGLSGSAFTPGLLIVNHSTGTSGIAPANASGWCGLGTYSFAGGTSGSVVVSDDFASSLAMEVADAIMFRYVSSPPIITRQPDDVQVVEGTDAALSLTSTGAAPLVCQWQFNGVNLPNAVGQTVTLGAVNRFQAGRYRAFLSNTDGSVFSREIMLSVVAAPLRSSLQNGMLLLEWDGGATLETATNIAGPFIGLSGVQPPLVVEPSDARRFFRLAQ
jgi:alpha-tubulin suppressor-like RCC1 family protein